MPWELAEEWWPELAALDADVVKVVGAASDARDCLLVFRALRRADRPTIAIAMGERGLASRVLALRFEQCLLTYAALEAGAGMAPGQLTTREMRSVYHSDRLGLTTRVYGLLGPHAEPERLVHPRPSAPDGGLRLTRRAGAHRRTAGEGQRDRFSS